MNKKIMIVKMIIMAALVVLMTCSKAHAEDFGVINRKDYNGVIVIRVEPDGIAVQTKSGISKLYFYELSPDVQRKYHYDPTKAAQFTAQQNAAIEAENAKLLAERERLKELDKARREEQARWQAIANAQAAVQATREHQQAMEERKEARADRIVNIMQQQADDSHARSLRVRR